MTTEMPKYKCHKEVWALKIKSVDVVDDRAFLSFEGGQFAPIRVPLKYLEKAPDGVEGGYYVVYQDGYVSWSPAEAFEAGYARVES